MTYKYIFSIGSGCFPILIRRRTVLIGLLIFYSLLSPIAHAQTSEFPIMRPEILKPSVNSVNFSNYSPSGVNFSTGDLTKNIPLVSLNSGSLKYEAGLMYNSKGGVLIDDWGGRVGINWNENFTTRITRVVKGVIDERSSSNFRNYSSDSMFAVDRRNIDRLDLLSASTLNGGKDGEYDIYNVNMKGDNLTFIFEDTVASLLNYSNTYRIVKLSNSVYNFLITDVDGNRYYFGGDGAKEIVVTKESNCNFSPLSAEPTVAWYLKRIESPTGDFIDFSYTLSASYPLVSTVTDQANMVLYFELAQPNCNDNSDPAPYYSSVRACGDAIFYKTPRLLSVISPVFRIDFDYEPRVDIPGEYMFTGFSIFSNDGLIEKIEFTYELVESVVGLNSEELDRLGNVDYTNTSDEIARLKKRYFLKQIDKFYLGNPVKMF
ncbi:MAG TPA: hypothetical protein PKE30_05365 [Niabella sp.]|nr:hypothetical protein [Niabella sp.]